MFPPLLAVFAGLMDASQGWQWVLKWGAIINAIGFLICFFTLEETNFHRSAALHQSKMTTPSTPGSLETNEGDNSNEKGKVSVADDSFKPTHGIQDYTPPDVQNVTLKTKTFTQRFFSLPVPSPDPWSLFAKCFYTPVLLLSVPIIFYCGFQVSFPKRLVG